MRCHSSICYAVVFGALLLTACGGASDAHGKDAQESTVADIRWQAPLTVARGAAELGPWRMNDSRFHYVDDPTVAWSEAGDIAVAWVDNERQNLFFQRYDGEGSPRLDEPANVSLSPNIFSWLPRVLLADEDRVYVLWQEIVFSGGSHGGEIYFARSEDGGAHFSEPLNLSDTTAGAGKGRLTEEQWDNGSLDLALGPEGDIFVAWTEYEGALRFRRSPDGGQSFGEVLRVSGDDQQPARGPSLALSPDGTLHLAWTKGQDPAADIHLAASDDGGQNFGSARVAHGSDGHSDAPALAVDTLGRVHLVYTESPAGPSTRSEVRYATLNEAGEMNAEPLLLSGEAGARAPAIDLDGEGRIYVTWEHQPDARARPRGLGIARSANGGETFTEPALVPGSDGPEGAINANLQGQLTRKLSVNDAGEVAVVNSHIRLADQSWVRLIRGEALD